MNYKKAVETALAASEGKTKTQLAAACGVTKTSLSRVLQTNNYTRQMLEKSAEFFGMKLSELAELGE